MRLTFAECGGGEIVVAVGWHFWVMEGLEGRNEVVVDGKEDGEGQSVYL